MSVAPLTVAEAAMLRSVFRGYPQIREVRLFGSRAKGTHTPHSDVDLAVFGKVTALQAQAIASELDDLPLPYKYDVQVFDLIISDELRDHILRVGIPIYPASDSIEASFQDITAGRTETWTVLRDISSADLRALMILALREANGSYRRVAELFHMGQDDYRQFMDFLRRKECIIDYRPYRR
jgi:predicted nucleotidyltransferase